MPFYAHRLDLPEAYQAATRIGRLVVLGKLDWGDTIRYGRRWAVMAHKITGVDALGAENRFCWASWEAATVAEHERYDAIRAIKTTLRPLIEGFAASGRLLAESHNTNADHGTVLNEEEVAAVVGEEVGWALRGSKRRGG